MEELRAIIEQNSKDLEVLKVEKKEKATVFKDVDEKNKIKLKKVKELTKQVDKMGK